MKKLFLFFLAVMILLYSACSENKKVSYTENIPKQNAEIEIYYTKDHIFMEEFLKKFNDLYPYVKMKALI